MSTERILIVEDEEDVLELIELNLRRNGYEVETAMDGREALTKAAGNIDLILLDLMLPEVDGLEICRQLKTDKVKSSVPIIMVTAKTEEADIVKGLELGADDYITKPFSPRELVARVKAVLRRGKRDVPAGKDMIAIHGIEINPGKHEVLVNGKTVNLTYTEFAILHYLARQPGWVFTRYQIVDAIRGSDYPVTDRAVDVQIVALRNKLGKAGKYIETVRGIGYKFKE